MGYKVNYKGLEVVVDTFEDLDELAERARNGNTNANANIKTNATVKADAEIIQSKNGSASGLNTLLENLAEKSLDLIKALANHGKPMTDAEVRKTLNLENNMQIAGRVSPLTRTANKYNVNLESFFKKTILNSTPGNRVYQYEIPKQGLAEVREALKNL